MSDHDTDLPALASLREHLATLNTPPGVEKELMAAFAARHTVLPWYRRLQPMHWGLAGASGTVAALLAVLVLTMQAPLPSALTAQDDRGDFIALLPLEQIQAEAAPRMVETRLPRTALDALGVPVTPDNADDTVRAEMLVSASGEPMAVRLSMN